MGSQVSAGPSPDSVSVFVAFFFYYGSIYTFTVKKTSSHFGNQNKYVLFLTVRYFDLTMQLHQPIGLFTPLLLDVPRWFAPTYHVVNSRKKTGDLQLPNGHLSSNVTNVFK